MPTTRHAPSAAGMNFTIVSDGNQYEIVECANGSEGVAALNQDYPASMGWMIVGHAASRDEADIIIEEHRNDARMDFE